MKSQLHVDQTPWAAEARVRRHVEGPAEADRLLQGRYQIINVWRPIGHPASDFPLAVVDWRTTRPDDLVKVDLLYPVRAAADDDGDDRGKEALPDAATLEETIKTVAPACKKHQPTTPAEGSAPAAQKGASRTETRILGEKHMHDGWKSDYTATDGHVEFGFEYGVAASLLASSKNGAPGFACDSRSLDGTSVSHALMIEMVVSKEWAPAGKPHLAAQTGTGRILRMQYHIMLTECAGLGVSWDNEAPPVYSDVPPSPPAYPNAQPIDYEALEMLDALRTSPEPRA
ncbi:Aspirochlorine biosynthesis protein N like [Verticillium longisporum]|nr:Aspirochlorine biosynthesis protein N like [Verticillium longisporum]